MGDIAVDFFLETLKNLIKSSNLDSIIDEKHQLQSLAEEIMYLRWFLKITEKKRNEHSEVMNLVTRIRDVVSEAENIVELFVALVSEANHASDSLHKHHDHLSLDLESVKKEINNLMAEVKQIYGENMYDIYDENMYDSKGVAVKKLNHSSAVSGGSSGGSNTSIVIEKKVVVGFKREVEILMKMLDDDREGRPLEIVSIVGPGGRGKTTLAREVYDHPFTSHVFDIRAWVDVSQDYDKTMKWDLLKKLLESLSPGEREDSEDMLGEKVYKYLKGRKYFIVMDDIWDIEAWNDIQRSFPKERKGSKLLFTSRQLVQPERQLVHVHRLGPLSISCSWELLQKKVFGMKCCPPELVDIGKRIAVECRGLPLSIVIISGILATEDKTLDVWEKVAEHLSSIIIAQKQQNCMVILELSYHYLPLHLKACFLYIGAHPEDYIISVHELIWLWIAEGFIQQSEGGKSLEAVAGDYLIGLIDRSLVMVATRSKSGGIKECRIHDLLREFCLKKAEEDNFFVRIYGDDSFAPSVTNKHRRLFFFRQFFDKFFFSRPYAQNLRSLLCLGSQYSRIELYISFFVENFKLLRVLSFIPDECRGEILRGHLVHLRYLALQLSRNAYFSLPFHLFNLETLTVQTSYLKDIKLPREIVKMVKLRHLYTKQGMFTYHFSYEEAASVGFDHSFKLDSLQTLHRICGCNECLNFLVRTPNLRKLGVCVLKVSADGVLMLPDLEFLKFLETLSLTYVLNHHLSEKVTSFPAGLKLPPTVTRLTLSSTYLKWEDLPIILQTLPSLEVLKLLDNACVGPVWNTVELEEGFCQLKYLRLEDLLIEEWNASEYQFPSLEDLLIRECKKLERIPIDFANLFHLREIKVERSSRSAEESARKIQEEQSNIKGDDDCLNLVITR